MVCSCSRARVQAGVSQLEIHFSRMARLHTSTGFVFPASCDQLVNNGLILAQAPVEGLKRGETQRKIIERNRKGTIIIKYNTK